jgi:hypothetical protein
MGNSYDLMTHFDLVKKAVTLVATVTFVSGVKYSPVTGSVEKKLNSVFVALVFLQLVYNVEKPFTDLIVNFSDPEAVNVNASFTLPKRVRIGLIRVFFGGKLDPFDCFC